MNGSPLLPALSDKGENSGRGTVKLQTESHVRKATIYRCFRRATSASSSLLRCSRYALLSGGKLVPMASPMLRRPAILARWRYVSWNFGEVNLVNHTGIEILFGVSQIELLPHKDIEEVGIDLAVEFECPQDRERLRQRLAFFVRPVLGSERFENVGDTHAARLHGHLGARQAAGIALAVH